MIVYSYWFLLKHWRRWRSPFFPNKRWNFFEKCLTLIPKTILLELLLLQISHACKWVSDSQTSSHGLLAFFDFMIDWWLLFFTKILEILFLVSPFLFLFIFNNIFAFNLNWKERGIESEWITSRRKGMKRKWNGAGFVGQSRRLKTIPCSCFQMYEKNKRGKLLRYWQGESSRKCVFLSVGCDSDNT